LICSGASDEERQEGIDSAKENLMRVPGAVREDGSRTKAELLQLKHMAQEEEKEGLKNSCLVKSGLSTTTR
jgi:hypothetical protein